MKYTRNQIKAIKAKKSKSCNNCGKPRHGKMSLCYSCWSNRENIRVGKEMQRARRLNPSKTSFVRSSK